MDCISIDDNSKTSEDDNEICITNDILPLSTKQESKTVSSIEYFTPMTSNLLSSVHLWNSMIGSSNPSILSFDHCILIPPSSKVSSSKTKEKPKGCRTIFVGGLPENIREEIVREVFERVGGAITTIRLSNKKFCHVRFEREESVEFAIRISEYRLKIDGKNDSANSGKLHVDVAHARDDQHEYEIKVRQSLRERRHQKTYNYDSLSDSLSLSSTHFSDHEAQFLIEDIKHEERFERSVQILIAWLERGEITKKNAQQFYSMIHSTNSHVRRLKKEKLSHDEEFIRCKERILRKNRLLFYQFGHIERVFATAKKQKAWDQFTRAQRKNMSQWRQSLVEFKEKHIKVNEKEYEGTEEEMEFSEDEKNDKNNKKRFKSSSTSSIDNDNYVCQMEDSYKNEIAMIKAEYQIKLTNQEQNMNELKDRFKYLESKNCQNREEHIRWIAITSTFLNVHPFGAKLDSICSHLQALDPSVTVSEIENILRKYSNVFVESLDKKWSFIGYNN